MRRIALFVVVIFLLSTVVLAERREVVNRKNRFGGKTVEITFDRKGNERRFLKRLRYFNSVGQLRREEVVFRQGELNTLGIDRGIERYDGDGHRVQVTILFNADKREETGTKRVATFFNVEGRKTREEVTYCKSQFQEQVYARSVDYYSIFDKKTRSVYFLTKAQERKTGYYKMVDLYDGDTIIKTELYDREGHAF